MSILSNAKQAVQGAAQAAMMKAVALAPDSWIPGGTPDPLIRHKHGHVGQPIPRLDGPLKVAGAAPFAAEIAMDDMVYAAIAYSTIAKGRIVRTRYPRGRGSAGRRPGDDAPERSADAAAAPVSVGEQGSFG